MRARSARVQVESGSHIAEGRARRRSGAVRPPLLYSLSGREAALLVGALWLLFGGTHVGLASGRVRSTLTGFLGEEGFLTVYSLVAVGSFSALVAFADHRYDGAAGLGWSDVPALRALCIVVIVAAFMLMIAALAAYARLPSPLSNEPIRTPRGIEKITRHPFFVGVAMMALAHVLLAPHLVGTVFFGGLAALALGGARRQDAKLVARRGAAYSNYVASTSILPFWAIATGRQRLELRDVPIVPFGVGAIAAIALRSVHPAILDHRGVCMILVVVGGAAVATVQSFRRSQHIGAVELRPRGDGTPEAAQPERSRPTDRPRPSASTP